MARNCFQDMESTVKHGIFRCKNNWFFKCLRDLFFALGANALHNSYWLCLLPPMSIAFSWPLLTPNELVAIDTAIIILFTRVNFRALRIARKLMRHEIFNPLTANDTFRCHN